MFNVLNRTDNIFHLQVMTCHSPVSSRTFLFLVGREKKTHSRVHFREASDFKRTEVALTEEKKDGEVKEG